MRAHCLRLRPGQDLFEELQSLVKAHSIRAAVIVTCVGSLTHVTLRLANQPGPTSWTGHFEIVSLVGTLSCLGSHVHLSVSNSTGQTIGGHLLPGNLIYTTAEICLAILPDVSFERHLDSTYGYEELAVVPAGPQ